MPFNPFQLHSASHERWISGCRSIFAGFVAKATEEQGQATIRNFWLTEQSKLLVPSLKDILQFQNEDSPSKPKASDIFEDKMMVGNDEEEEEVRLQYTLYDLLNSSKNKFTTIASSTLSSNIEPIDLKWILTDYGKEAFRILPSPKSNLSWVSDRG